MPKRGGRKGPKKSKEDQVKERIKSMIEKTQKLQQIKQQEANLLKIQQQQLQSLLAKSINGNKLKEEIKNIARGYKDSVRNNKNKRKERLQIRREQRRREKEQVRKRKQDFYNSINAARINTLPSKADINGSNILNIYLDGWNILPCDNACRKQIRKKKRYAIAIFCTLLNEFTNNKDTLKLDYDMNLRCLFDGNGVDKKDGNISVIFTGRGLSVDDKLVNDFNAIKDKNEMKCNLVVTSDRQLTYRLYKCGIYVMKSSVFYKLMMDNMNKVYGITCGGKGKGGKENENSNNKMSIEQLKENEDNDKEEKKEDEEEDDIDEELAKRIAMKMNLHSDEDDNNNNNNPDLIEGNGNNNNNENINNPTDIMEQDNENDYTFNDNDEFDEIFDENMENMDDIDDED